MADTDILLSVDLDTTAADKTAEQLQKEIEGIFNSRQGRQSASLTSLELQMKKMYDKATELKNKMQELSQSSVATEEYAKLTDSLDKYEAKYYSLIEKMSQFEEAGGDISSAKYQQWVSDFEKVEASLGTIHQRMEEMEKSGTAYISGKETEEYKKLEAELDTVNDKLKQQIIRHRELSEDKVPAVTKQVEQLGRATTKVQKATQGIGKSIGKYIGKFAMLFLGVRGLYSLFMKIRSAIAEGFKNLRESGVGNLKKQMNDLTNACTTLKNALAGAFEPIVTTIIPYIQRLVEWLTVAIDKLAQFIAAMKGQTTYVKAIKQVGDAAGKANKQLAKFDELNVLSSQGNGAAGMFEEAAISSDMIDKVAELKEKFEELKKLADEIIIQPFKEGFLESAGDIRGKMDSIKENMRGIRESLTEIFSSPEVQTSITNFISTLSHTIGQNVGSIVRIGTNIADNITGGFEMFLENNKTRIQEDIINTFDLSSSIVDKYGDLSQAIGEISDALSTNEAKEFTSSLIDLGYTFGSESVQLALKVINDLVALFSDPIIANVDNFKQSLTQFFEDITPLVISFKDATQRMFDNINTFYDTYISPMINDAKHLLTELLASIMPIVNEIAKIITLIAKIGDAIREKLQPLFELIIGVIGPKITYVINSVSAVVQATAKIIVDILYYIFRFLRFIFEAVYDLITGDVEGLFNDFADYWDDTLNRLKEAVQWLADLFTEKWEVCKQAIKDFKDGVIGFIDALIDKFNIFNLSVEDVTDTIKGLTSAASSLTGGALGNALALLNNRSSSSSTTPKRRGIPGYASGQVIPPTMSAHLAVLGDNKHETEVVSPLSTMQEAMINALQAVGIGGEGQPINIYLGTDKIYSEIRKMEKRNTVMGG